MANSDTKSAALALGRTVEHSISSEQASGSLVNSYR
jgi:hypothetical protein